MTRREAINSFRRGISQAKKRFEIDKKHMDMSEVKELKFYIQRDEMAVRALEIVDGGFCSECVEWHGMGMKKIEKLEDDME